MKNLTNLFFKAATNMVVKLFDLQPDLVSIGGYGDAVINKNGDASFDADHMVGLPERDRGKDIVRVHNTHIDKSKAATDRFYRRQALTIINTDSGEAIVRFVMGSGAACEGMTHHSLGLDYDAVDELGIKKLADIGEDGVTLEVRPATPEELLNHFYNHRDLDKRMSTRHAIAGLQRGAEGKALGVIGVWLGVIGVFLGLASFF